MIDAQAHDFVGAYKTVRNLCVGHLAAVSTRGIESLNAEDYELITGQAPKLLEEVNSTYQAYYFANRLPNYCNFNKLM